MPFEGPCKRELYHTGRCSPSLKNMKFGKGIVISDAPKGNFGKARSNFYFRNRNRVVLDRQLISGKLQGIRGIKNQSINALGLTEYYASVAKHWHCIFNPKESTYENYKGMPFFDDWNPKKGGSYLTGAIWILNNLGKRPSSNHSLGIVVHADGFVPGNLEWQTKSEQQREKRYNTLGNIPKKKFEAEMLRRGYRIVAAS